MSGLLHTDRGFSTVRAVCAAAIAYITGRTEDALVEQQATARAALLSNEAALRAMHDQDWTHDAMRAFGSRFGVEDDDFIAVWDRPYGDHGPKCVCWRLNPDTFPRPRGSSKTYRRHRVVE